eukprot:15479273-Alexandrium_andersonii.AAC.1
MPDTFAGAAAMAEAWLVAFGEGDAPEMRRAAAGRSFSAGESSSAELSAGATVEPSEAPAAVAAASAATAA